MEETPDQNDNYKCSDCGEKFAKAISLEWHKDKSAACRLIRARNRILQQIRANQPLPQGPVVEDAPLADFDEPPDFQILEDYDPSEEPEDDDGPRVPNETAARKRIFDSCEQVAAFIKRNRLSNKQTDELLNLWRDDRLRMREVLDTFKSHRDVDRYLMSQLVGEVSKNITCKSVSHALSVQEHHSPHPYCSELYSC
jgi:DNA-directed RNA polymerase subunit RPC12/RpoP